MVHFTCDLCGKELGEDQRYVVRIESCAAGDPGELTEADLDDDHMEAVSQILLELEDEDVTPSQARRSFRYDMCPHCHDCYVRDPLGKEHLHKFHFVSKN